jgi:hypothetical protein
MRLTILQSYPHDNATRLFVVQRLMLEISCMTNALGIHHSMQNPPRFGFACLAILTEQIRFIRNSKDMCLLDMCVSKKKFNKGIYTTNCSTCR